MYSINTLLVILLKKCTETPEKKKEFQQSGINASFNHGIG